MKLTCQSSMPGLFVVGFHLILSSLLQLREIDIRRYMCRFYVFPKKRSSEETLNK